VNNSLSVIPIPFIEEISSNGLIRVIWNVNMIIPFNLTALTFTNSSKQIVPLEVRILAGSSDQELFNLNITSYNITNFTKREMLV
jgi:hypothetical protein